MMASFVKRKIYSFWVRGNSVKTTGMKEILVRLIFKPSQLLGGSDERLLANLKIDSGAGQGIEMDRPKRQSQETPVG